MATLRNQRIAENQAALRSRNEGGGWPVAGGRLAYLCECGRDGCVLRVEMSREEYLEVREAPRRFAVVPGHEQTETEDVVLRNDRHFVVQKHDGA